MSTPELHTPTHPVRFVTASALFDGHDASINIMRRIMQSQGAEVIHLGHNRSVQEVVDAAIDEDVQGVAVSSYQGGHVEYFEYLTQLLREQGAGHVKVFGGGGGVIVPEEIARLREAGVTIFSPEDGQRLGLPGMINTLIADCDTDVWEGGPVALEPVLAGERAALARAISGAELRHLDEAFLTGVREAAERSHAPVLGLTGTGGSGKSSLTDELVRRFRVDQQDKLRIAVIAVDPTRRKGGGALLGDRIRMNSLGESTSGSSPVFFRSLATRGDREVPEALSTVIDLTKAAGFDLVIVETPGIGQGDAAIVPFVDVPMYVMTPEFGAASQLEKIDMLDFAEVVAINKFERRGAADALRDAVTCTLPPDLRGLDFASQDCLGLSTHPEIVAAVVEGHSVVESVRTLMGATDPTKAARRDRIADIEIIEGQPAEVILQRSVSLGADMILMGSHEHGLSHTFLGTVAKRVMRRSRARAPMISSPPCVRASAWVSSISGWASSPTRSSHRPRPPSTFALAKWPRIGADTRLALASPAPSWTAT